jgi:hypothetical protein
VNTRPRLALLRLRSHCWFYFVGCQGKEEGGGERCLGQRFASRGGLEGAQGEDRIHCDLVDISVFTINWLKVWRKMYLVEDQTEQRILHAMEEVLAEEHILLAFS